VNITENTYNLAPISSNLPDRDKPLSFQIWKNNYEIILPEQQFFQYNEYLVNWYKNKNTKQTDTKTQIKINFLNLLKQIQIFFTDEEKENWYTQIDIDNEKEVLLAIPYFARKLKDISLYYLELRQEIKRSKLKYNLAGSNESVVRQIQELLLQNYSKRDNQTITLPSTLWNQIPELSSIKNNLVIEIEELYDTSTYFDRTNTLPPSTYLSLEQKTNDYFLKKGINLSDIDWVYRLGTFTVSSLYDSTLQESTTLNLTGLYFDLAKKYLGSNRYSTFFIPSSARKDFFTININQGNNFFYYPSSPYKTNAKNLPRYISVPLSSTELQTLGTPGSSVDIADTLFVKTKNGIEGAWLRAQPFDVKDVNMKAIIEGANSTIFRFPYPGFGVSAEDLQWTGYGLETDPRFFYLDESTKKLIEDVYWSSSFSLSGIVPIPINSTSLIFNRAHASENFELADKIRIWPVPPQFNSANYFNTVQETWLYKFLKTSISIASNEDNTLIWPYQKVIPDPRGSLPNFPYDICSSQSLSSISLPFATGSTHISSADIIYKVNNYLDDKRSAVECAWLSASNYFYPQKHTYGSKQTHFSGIFQPGVFSYFIWDGNDLTNINNVIPGSHSHLPNCKYVTTLNTTYLDFHLCTCKQTLFTPFGHPGENYFSYTGLADYIVEDVGYIPPSQGILNLSQWKDENGLSFANSPNACWFKTNKNIGWGHGRWYSGGTLGNNFFLRKGKRYIYYRAGIQDKNPSLKQFPELVVRYSLVDDSLQAPTRTSVWINAIKNELGEWVSDNTPSQMIIHSNDVLIYSRTDTTSFNITGSYFEPANTIENRGSIWSNFDYFASDNPNINITVTYPPLYSNQLPATKANEKDFYKQYPEVGSNAIERIVLWKVTAPDGSNTTFSNVPLITFKPSLTGLYTVAVTALTSLQTFPANTNNLSCDGYYYFSNIPPITSAPNIVEVQTLSTYKLPIPGFVLQTKLNGWNYVTNTQVPYTESLTATNIGAKPIWVQSIVNKEPGNDYKSVESWSPALSFFDKYNPAEQPVISDIVLKGGEYIEYKRKPQTQIVWNENITIKNITDKREWCKLKQGKTDLTTPYIPVGGLLTYQTDEPSTIFLQNFVENEPVEIYYNAIQPFVWNITADLIIPETTYATLISSLVFTSEEPWANLTNQFYPTVAFLPSFDKLISNKQLGNYFKPNNLGLLTYVNKDYTFEITLSSIKTTDLYETPSKKIDNRGLTRQDQFSPFNIIEEDNTWIKEPYITGSLAGVIKNSVFKRFQKFIPYQSLYESNFLTNQGITTPKVLQYPWGGFQDTEWIDDVTRPVSFTGQINVGKWTELQTLKNTNLQLDNWSSDIYGNQYGLYKNIKNLTPSQRLDVTGQLWIQKNSQFTTPAYNGMLNVFDSYKFLPLYSELTGYGIKRFDVFYDTLFIETTGALIFEKIQYDYNTSDVFSIIDFARGISLAIPTTNTLNREFTFSLPLTAQFAKAGDIWFLSKEKQVYIAVLELQDLKPVPILYTLDLTKTNLTKAITINDLNALNCTSISKPKLSYCSSKKEFLYTFTAKDTNNQNIIVSISIQKTDTLIPNNIKIYSPLSKEDLPPIVFKNDEINLSAEETFIKQLSAKPQTAFFESINIPNWATLTNTGILSGTTPNISQTTILEFKVTNSIGPTYSSLSINVT